MPAALRARPRERSPKPNRKHCSDARSPQIEGMLLCARSLQNKAMCRASAFENVTLNLLALLSC